MKSFSRHLAAALAGFVLSAAAALAQASEPLRIAVLVHGWNGSLDSFGILPKLLTEAAPGHWPADSWQVVPITFKTPRPDATLPEQAAAVAVKIQSALGGLAKKFPGRPREIWFITHSMGGLIVRHLYLEHREKPETVVGAAFRDLKGAILVAPPNQGSDEVRFALVQLEASVSGFTGGLLSDRSLKSLTNKAIGAFLKGIPLEQAYNMAAGSDFIESLNLGWQKAGACESFPLWILAGAHDVVVDLANANINALQVSPGEDGRTRCVRCSVDPARVRYYPYNHSNTNRRDGILGSIEGADHPVFSDIARILTAKPLPPLPSPVGPSKVFLRLRHPAGDRITDVQVEPFEGALTEAHSYEAALPDGKVVGFRQKDFVVLAGRPASLVPVSGSTLITIRAKGARKGLLPPLVPYAPKVFKAQLDWGPQGIVRGTGKIAYRPVQISLPAASLTTNSVVSITVPLSEAPEAVAEAAIVIPGACPNVAGDPAARVAAAEKALTGRELDEIGPTLRRLGGTQDAALVPVLVKFTKSSYPAGVQRAAVAALGDLRVTEALAPLKEIVDAKDGKLDAMAIDALGRVPSSEAVEALVELLATPGDARLERAALAGLSQVPEPMLRAAIDRALTGEVPAGKRSRVSSLALACGVSTPDMMATVANQALAASDARVAPDPYGRILDTLVEHATPDDRTWIRRLRNDAGQKGDATWTRKLLARVGARNRPAGAPGLADGEDESDEPVPATETTADPSPEPTAIPGETPAEE